MRRFEPLGRNDTMRGFFKKVAEHIDKLDSEGQRKQYRLLVEELSFFESVFRSMREGVLVVDSTGRTVYANEAVARLTGFDCAKAKGRPVRHILPDWDWNRLLAPSDEGDGWARQASCELEVSYPERRILEIQSTPSANGTVLLVRDVTLAHAREASALESGRTDAVCELASGVAHEIGNPLNALSLNLEMLAREFRREPDAERRARLLSDIDVARQEVKRIDAINRSFLAALRPVALDLAPGSPADPLKDTLAEMRNQFEERRIHVSLDLPPALPPVMIDRAQMRQVFFNIVKNALEAMKDGGSLDIEIAADDNNVYTSFRDSGAGISDAALARIFEPYRTTKAKGNGLGLMICRRIVRAHGGDIDVESKSGAGTKFTVTLPRLERRVRRLS